MLSFILNHLFPSRCPDCLSQTDTVLTAPFCRQCWSSVRKYAGPRCRICGLPFASAEAELCGNCTGKRPFFSGVQSFGLYDGVLASAINLYKFHGIRRLARPLGRLLLDLTSAADAVVAVPLSSTSLRQRGFNQSLLIARVLSKHLKAPLIFDGLAKIRETRPQVGLSAKERAANLRGAYRAGGNCRGMRVLLVDDVMTTGATANECSKELIRAGAKEVRVVTLARAANL